MGVTEVPSFEGKKVYFVHPSSVIQREMVDELIRREFEVLLVEDPQQAVRHFLRHPDCLAFLNLDEGLTEPEWEDYVRMIQSDPDLRSVRLGILTYNPDPDLARKYLLDLEVPCGYITLSLGLQESTKTVVRALEFNEARGRRKYVRVHCPDRPPFNWQTAEVQGELRIEGRILDLSTAGMACLLTKGEQLPLHAYLKGIQLKLRGRLCLVDGIVMGHRRSEVSDGEVYVIVFSPKTGADQKEKIRVYLKETLQAEIDRGA